MSTPESLLPLLNSSDQGKPGELPAHAWPGGYTTFYISPDSDTLCAGGRIRLHRSKGSK